MISTTQPRPSPGTIDLADGIARIQELLDSREWWMFVVASRQSVRLARAVIERHYATGEAAAKGYAAAVVPIGPGEAVALILCRKTFMLPAELAALAGVDGLDGSQDVILCPDTELRVVTWIGRTFR